MIEIAIDGTSASGKGTLAKKLSQKYAIPHLDTGLMYRKVASEILKNKIDYNKLSELSCQIAKVSNFENLQNEELRTEKIAQMASKIAVFPALRNMLNLKQKEFIGKVMNSLVAAYLMEEILEQKYSPTLILNFL